MKLRRSVVVTVVAIISLWFAGLSPRSEAGEPAMTPAAKGAKHKVVFQVSDSDPKKWNLALNNIKNVQADLGKDNVEIELVAYGPGLGILKLDSEVADRISDTVATGIKVVACENTMKAQKLTKADMLPNIGYVRAGVTELIFKQEQGYAYVRP